MQNIDVTFRWIYVILKILVVVDILNELPLDRSRLLGNDNCPILSPIESEEREAIDDPSW